MSDINGVDRDGAVRRSCCRSPRRKTADADMKLDDRGRKIEDEDDELDFGENVLIVDPVNHAASINRAAAAEDEPNSLTQRRRDARQRQSRYCESSASIHCAFALATCIETIDNGQETWPRRN